MRAAFVRPKTPAGPQGPATDLPLDYLLSLRSQPFRHGGATQRGLTHLPGATLTRLRGRGLEFDDLRPYAEGDDVRHIDWKVTARTGRPYTRLYREERERAVTVAVDLRTTMFTGSQRLRAVAAGEIAARIIWAVSARGDRAGVLAFDDAGMAATRPAARDRGVIEAIAAIAGMFENGKAAARSGVGQPRPLDDIIGWVNRSSRTGGDVLLVTGFDTPGGLIEAELAEAGKRARLSLLLVDDPVEVNGLPPGRYIWRSGETSSVVTLDAKAARQLTRRLAELRQRRRETILRLGVPVLGIDGSLPPSDLIARLGQAGMI
jgi:uncharacterized protein (DUF58 family)